ncbi:MAG: matrixin family metalloprotease [Planctomycetales bacterium]|nr:matrixin family metalloprotease [Planctomycetales bacterium]
MNIPTRARTRVQHLCCALTFFVLVNPASTAPGFDIGGRWSSTQIDGSGLQRGDPVTLRWSIVPDGHSYDRSANSNLIQFLDDGWNVAAAQRTADFTNRPWFDVISNAYAQYSRVSSIAMTYVPEQNAAGVSTGQFGDIRIGGENLDGTPGGALADNTYPDGGDMRIDTTRENDGSVGFYFASEPGLRNLVIHETGHGVGLGHAQFVNGSAKAVMEGGLRTDIWGLQFDDVYALNRQYGDPQERGSGNNTYTTATSLGDFTTTGRTAMGLDASDSVVNQFDDDWLGIDGRNDADWFKFSVTGQTFAKLKVTPIGPTYETVQQGVFNAAAQNDLVLQLFSATPSLELLTTSDSGALGAAELINSQYLSGAGDYYFRVRGKQDLNQFYRIDLLLDDRLPSAGTSADLNFDGVATADDWALFVANASTTFPETTGFDAFKLGDLDLDGDNDYADFKFFKTAYELANGAGSFAALTAVPEPATLLLAGVATLMAAVIRRRRG